MNSPFLRNRQRKLARMAGNSAPVSTAPAPPPENSEAGQEYAALRVRLHDDLRKLSDIESKEARQPVKHEMQRAYAAWIDGVLDADMPVQDEILLTNMVWAIDHNDFDYALKLGEFAIRHGLEMKPPFHRSVACLLREDIAEMAIQHPGLVDHAILIRTEQMTANADMPDQAKAKLYKAMGISWLAKADAFDASAENAPAGGAAAYTQTAMDNFKAAFRLDKKSGVKRLMENTERLLRQMRTANEQKAGQQAAG